MKRFLYLVLVLVVFVSSQLPVYASEQTVLLPSGLPYSELKASIDAYVAEHEETTAAVAVAVFARDQILLEGYYGQIDIEQGITNSRDAVFEWGSCTKLLTWVSVMQLVEKGAIDLNEDIRTYLPDGFLRKLSYDQPITVLNLMNHNAGWQETVTDLFIADQKDVKELGSALRLIEPEQVNQPGAIVAYSNWGSALAGYIVELVSGQSFSAYVQQNIFTPLKMQHTALSADLADNAWVSKQRDQLRCYTTDNQSLGTNRFYLSLYPAGAATGTLGDFLRFAQALVPAAGSPSPLFAKRATLDQLLSPSLYFADGKTARNHHGFWTDELGVPVLWHNGGTLGSSSWFAFNPETGTGIVTLTNHKGETVYNVGLLPMVFGTVDHVGAAQTSPSIAGVYTSSRSCYAGYPKLYSLFTTMQLSPDGQGGYMVAGNGRSVTSLSANSYLMDMGGVKNKIYTDTDGDGRMVLQMQLLASDYVEINGYGLIAKLVLLGLFALSALYGCGSLIVGLVNLAKNRTLRPISGWRMTVDLALALAGGSFIYIAVTLFTSSTPLFASIRWSLVLNGLLALIPLVYLGYLIRQWRGLNNSKREKGWLIASGVAGLLMTVNMVFWEAYKFW